MRKKNKKINPKTRDKVGVAEEFQTLDINYSPYITMYLEAQKERYDRQNDIHKDFDYVSDSPEELSPYLKASYKARQSRQRAKIKAIDHLEDIGAVPSKTNGGKIKRRRVFLSLILVFMALFLAVAVLGYFDIVPEYVSLYEKSEDINIEVTDPIIGGLIKLEILEGESEFYNDFLKNIDSQDAILIKVIVYALPIAIALAIITALAIFIVTLASILRRGNKGYVQKTARFGFLFIILMVLMLTIAVFGLIWNGDNCEILKFFTFSASTVSVGIGWYIMMGLSVISFIAYLFSYKRPKRKPKESKKKK